MTADFDTAELTLSTVYGDSSLVRDMARKRVTHHSGLPLRWQDSAPVSGAEMTHPSQLISKRLFDVAVSVAALVVLGPLLLLVAAIIKATSTGPVFFRQEREGFHGKSFNVFKFRSMRTEDCDVSGINQTVVNDPRITPIGRFIRKTSIDELPQLFNVLLGDMSLVGPRPHVAGMMAGGMRYDALVPYYDLRLQMRPGLTGWAQANGFRGPTTEVGSAIARVDHDIAYIQNFSIWLDIRIIVQTAINEFFLGSGH